MSKLQIFFFKWMSQTWWCPIKSLVIQNIACFLQCDLHHVIPASNGLVVGTVIGPEQRNCCDMTQNHEIMMTSASFFKLYSILSDVKTHIYPKAQIGYYSRLIWWKQMALLNHVTPGYVSISSTDITKYHLFWFLSHSFQQRVLLWQKLCSDAIAKISRWLKILSTNR